MNRRTSGSEASVTEAGGTISRSYSVSEFRPAWWLAGAHAQTLVGRFLRRRLRLSVRGERIETPDGDFLDLDVVEPLRPTARTPLVLALHGLEGSTRSGYMLALFRNLSEHGIRCVGMNFRSCGGEPNRLPRLYHAGETTDLAFVLDLLRDRFPEAPVGLVGFSLGGNVLLKFLGERGSEVIEKVDAAVAISVPFDLAAGANRLERGFGGKLYTTHFVRKLVRKTRAKAELVRDRCHLDRLDDARTLREFDDAATAPLHGFRDAEHYYAESSSTRYLPGIRVPTLLLHADDDPFLPAGAVPRRAICENPFLVPGFTGRGGHVGFVSGSPWSPVFWAEREAAHFLAAHLWPPR